MLKKNDEYIDVVIDVGSNGEGVIKRDDHVIFTPFVALGETVKYKILKVQKNIAYAKVLDVVVPSDYRVIPTCPVFGKCGGCQLQHLNYNTQLFIKRNNVQNCFDKISGLNVDVENVVPSDFVFNYRNKLQLPVGQTDNGTVIGFYAENSHRIIPISDCPINPSWTKDVIKAFYRYINTFNVKGYDSNLKKGEIREITVKEIDNKLIITAVFFNKNIRGKDELISILKEELKQEFSLFINVNDKDTNVIYGEEFIKLYGENDYTSEMFNIKYKTGVLSFMQVNKNVCEKLYSAVKNSVSTDKNTTVIDAYSGAGLMTALVSENAKKAIGIEIIKEAVDCADELVKINGLENKITNYCGKCEELLPDILKKEKKDTDKITVILDPPRKGVDIKVIEAIKKCDIDRIVYVSCLPSSLARDVGLLTGALEYVDGKLVKTNKIKLDYAVEFVRPFDMFPQTKHVETLVCLTKNRV